jgi:hypothetical protein
MSREIARSTWTGWTVASGLAALAVLGCNGGGGSRKSGSITNPPATNNSNTNTGPVNSNTITPPTSASKVNANLKVVSAILEDSNGDHVVSKGDILTVRFSQAIKVTATSPAGELELLNFGDSFGTGATLAGVTTSTTDAVVVLGTDPKMKVTGTFSSTGTGPYQPSGIDVDAAVAGIKDATGLLPSTGIGVDVTSKTLLEGCYSLALANMKYARGLHTATLLDDGMVLVVGGISATGPNTANYQRENELFDPLTNRCSVLSSPTLGGTTNGYMLRRGQNGLMIKVGRYAHTATKLQNGKVLIAGGNGFEDNTAAGALIYGVLGSCFLYDPVAHSFTETGKLAKARRDHFAVPLAGGTKVLVFGGRDANGTMAQSEIYDMATGVWTAGPNMVAARYDASIVNTPTGVHVLGGASITASGTYTDVPQDEIYDPATNTFAAAPVSLAPRSHLHTATLLDTGDILLAGGYGGGALLKTVQLYNRVLGQWLPAGNMTDGRERHVATRVDGDVLVSGGMYVDSTGTVKTVDSVETIGGGSSTRSPLGFPRLSHTATLLKDGRTVILGGFRNPTKDIRGMDGTSVGNVEVFVRP